MAKAEWKLRPKSLRNTLKSIPGCREVETKDEALLCFITGLTKPGNPDKLAKVNIYCRTGTIDTCRVQNGEVRHVFRRNVSSMDTVKRILTDPPKLTTIDSKLVSMDNVRPDTDKKRLQKASIQAKVELADVGIAILMGEKEKLEGHLDNLQNNDSDDENGSEVADGVTGMEFEFSLPKESMNHVEQCLTEIMDMGKRVTCVATNGRGTMFLYGLGGIAFTPNIPKVLYNKMKQISSKDSARPVYAALGSRDRFYVGFDDGTAEWKGPKALDKCLRRITNRGQHHQSSNSNMNTQPRSVAFGSTYDSFFVVNHDGSWECQGRGVPEELVDKLSDRLDRPDLVCVTLGPKGEFFLKAENGRMWWGGITSEFDALIQELLDSERYLDFMDFGEDGSFFLSYD